MPEHIWGAWQLVIRCPWGLQEEQLWICSSSTNNTIIITAIIINWQPLLICVLGENTRSQWWKVDFNQCISEQTEDDQSKLKIKHKNATQCGKPSQMHTKCECVMWKLDIAAGAGLHFVEWREAKTQKAQCVSSHYSSSSLPGGAVNNMQY